MAMLKWDAHGKRKVENGVSKGVLYPHGKTGVVWNGLIAVSEKASGGDNVALYADNHQYGSIRTYENYEATIEAYMYPEEFSECDGSRTVTDGVKIGQQNRLPFDFCFRTEIFTDTGDRFGNAYKIHLVYNATASPSEVNYNTLNDSPDAVRFSWDIHCIPFLVRGSRAASTIVLDSSEADRIKMEAIEKILYGTGGEPPRMPSPDEVLRLIKRLDLHRIFMDLFTRSGKWVWDTFNFVSDTIPIAIDREAERHVYNEPEQGTVYNLPAVAYSMLSESADGVRNYMVIVADTARPSEYVEALKTELDLRNEEVLQSEGVYYYTYTLNI